MSNTDWKELNQEYIPDDEEQKIQSLIELTAYFHQKQHETIGQYRRGQHTKDTGCVRAEFIIESGLPENLKYGVFREPKTFKAIVRFSNGASIPSSDKEPNGRGMAIKLLDVEGPKVLQDSQDQDFIMVNHPTFPFADVDDYNMLFSDMKLFGPDEARKRFGLKYPEKGKMMGAIVSKNVTNPLDIQYWSESPYCLGTQAMKFTAKPQIVYPKTTGDNGDFLFKAAVETLKQQEIYFDFLVQLQSDPQKTPVEDVSIEWKEDECPFYKVATVKIFQQDLDSKEMQAFRTQCELFAWNPWYALIEHKPLGGINRLRKEVYLASARRRLQECDRGLEERQ